MHRKQADSSKERTRELLQMCAQTAFATCPTAKVSAIAFYYNLGENSLNSTHTPTLTLEIDIEKNRGKVGEASYYRD